MKIKKQKYKWEYSLLWKYNDIKKDAVKKQTEIIKKLNSKKDNFYINSVYITDKFLEDKKLMQLIDISKVFHGKVSLNNFLKILKNFEEVTIFENDIKDDNSEHSNWFINIKKSINFQIKNNYKEVCEVNSENIEKIILSSQIDGKIAMQIYLLDTKNKYNILFNDWIDRNFIIRTIDEIDNFILKNNLKDYFDIKKREFIEYRFDD